MTYKLLSYQSGGQPRAGLLVDGKIHDAARVTGESAYQTVFGALQAWEAADGAFRRAAQKIAAGEDDAGAIALADAQLLAPVLYPGAIFGAGANYLDHVEEMNRAHGFDKGPTMKDLGRIALALLEGGAQLDRGSGRGREASCALKGR
ncbi:hypothetical protein LP415_18645 [Polaromonas sp. P1(28)-8]|nr:hypothetical protein LP415_18645 [Polaromonas sp. P1(28)-8]